MCVAELLWFLRGWYVACLASCADTLFNSHGSGQGVCNLFSCQPGNQSELLPQKLANVCTMYNIYIYTHMHTHHMYIPSTCGLFCQPYLPIVRQVPNFEKIPTCGLRNLNRKGLHVGALFEDVNDLQLGSFGKGGWLASHSSLQIPHSPVHQHAISRCLSLSLSLCSVWDGLVSWTLH